MILCMEANVLHPLYEGWRWYQLLHGVQGEHEDKPVLLQEEGCLRQSALLGLPR